MSFTSVALQMVTVSLPILLGWCISKLGFMKAEFERELSRLLLQVALPCLVLSSALGDDVQLPSVADTFSLMGLSIVMYVVAIVIVFAVTAVLRVPKGTECSYRFAVLFGNAGFIGFPVVQAVLGKQALLYASIALIPLNIFMFTVGVMLFSGAQGGLKKQLRNLAACCKNPGLIASVVVLVIVLTGWTDWGVVGDSISIVGTMTTPAALLLMGSSIAKYHPLDMLTNWRAYVAVAFRLVIVPVACLAVARVWPGMTPMFITTLVLEMAMPVGSNGTLYCLQYGKDARPMMQCAFLSIICSILTIPLVTMLCG